jgi:hypothetical protein
LRKQQRQRVVLHRGAHECGFIFAYAAAAVAQHAGLLHIGNPALSQSGQADTGTGGQNQAGSVSQAMHGVSFQRYTAGHLAA